MEDQKACGGDIDDLRYIQQNEQQINGFFRQMQFKVKDFDLSNDNKPQEIKNQQKLKRNSLYKNNRGQVVLPIQKLRQNYQRAIPGTKWLTLPYCRRTIFGKIQFWCGASFIFTYMWGSYYMRKHNLKSLNFKQYRNAYGVFALASVVYVFTESTLFEPYCDINSYHYNPNDNLFVARDIKKQLQELAK